MKFKAFFLTITIQKRKLSQKEILREQHIQNIMDEVKSANLLITLVFSKSLIKGNNFMKFKVFF